MDLQLMTLSHNKYKRGTSKEMEHRLNRREFFKTSLPGGMLLSFTAFQQPSGARGVPVGSEKQLFIDDLLIESSKNIQLTMNRPCKTGERLIVSEHPWEEHRVGAYNTIVEDEGFYKMWYHTMSRDSRFLCYVTSHDGLDWQKPTLGLIEYRGSNQNNIVMLPRRAQSSPIFGAYQTSCPTVFIDPQASRTERYKCLIQYRQEEEGKPLGEPWLLVSSDGLRWRPLVEQAVFEDRPFTDTQMIAFWDRRIEKYVAYGRSWDPEWPKGIRKVSRTETRDLSHWPKPKLVFGRDEQDPENCHFYNSAAIQYPYAERAYLMFTSAYYPYQGDGPLDVQLVVSRDGIQWGRPERKPFLGLGTKGSFDSGSIYVGAGMVRKGDDLWLYYTGYDFSHGNYNQQVDRNKGVISRAVLRLDGFVSADAAYTGGELTTVPLSFAGSRLDLNLNTSAGGSAEVELLDAQGVPIPGFSGHDCDVIRANSVTYTVRWKGSSDVSSLQGKTVKLRFRMRDAKLFAFQFLNSAKQ